MQQIHLGTWGRFIQESKKGSEKRSGYPKALTDVSPVYPESLGGNTISVDMTNVVYFVQDHLWNGNRERLWEHFLTRDSLFLWALKTYRFSGD